MREVIFAERFLKFVYHEFGRQIEAGEVIPEFIYKSDQKNCPLHRIMKFENEIRETVINVSVLKNLRSWIEAIDAKANTINDMYGLGKTGKKYLVYTYSDDSFGVLTCSDEVKFKYQARHGYFDIVQYFRRIYSLMNLDEQPDQAKGFLTTLSPDKMEPLFLKLKGNYIAQNTDFGNFVACFSGEPLPSNFEPVQWIKRPRKRKNAPAKKALTDLLVLMGISKDQSQDSLKLKSLFTDYTGKPIEYVFQDFNNNKSFADHSEYYPELQAIINSLT